jgi:hypothetical protein
MAKKSKKPVLKQLAEMEHIMVKAVLLTAIDNYVSHVASLTVEEVKEELGGAAGFFSPAGWRDAAIEVKRMLDEAK